MDRLTLEEGPNNLSRNVGNNLPKSQKNINLIYVTMEAWNLSKRFDSVLQKAVFRATLYAAEEILGVVENCTARGYYAASSGDVLPTFHDNLSVQYSGFGFLKPWKFDWQVVPKRR